MIDYINATIVQKALGYVIVDCNGIGYKLLVSENTSCDLVLDEKKIIYTYLILKEDSITLVGFSKLLEREMFETLISVSKIGAKIALSILSTYNPSQIARFIKSSDIVSISKVSGLGKKTAERLVLELKDKVDIFAGNEENTKSDNIPKLIKDDTNLEEAVQALNILGFTLKEAQNAVQKAYDIDENSNTEQLIKVSLSLLKK